MAPGLLGLCSTPEAGGLGERGAFPPLECRGKPDVSSCSLTRGPDTRRHPPPAPEIGVNNTGGGGGPWMQEGRLVGEGTLAGSWPWRHAPWGKGDDPPKRGWWEGETWGLPGPGRGWVPFTLAVAGGDAWHLGHARGSDRGWGRPGQAGRGSPRQTLAPALSGPYCRW